MRLPVSYVSKSILILLILNIISQGIQQINNYANYFCSRLNSCLFPGGRFLRTFIGVERLQMIRENVQSDSCGVKSRYSIEGNYCQLKGTNLHDHKSYVEFYISNL